MAPLFCAVVTACWTMGPKYQRPSVTVPAAYKEMTEAQRRATAGWKTADPKDAVLRGQWWERFQDSRLNDLETKVNVSNQNIAASFAAYMASRALVREARAQYFPTLSTQPAFNAQKGLLVAGVQSGTFTQFSIPFNASWAPDLWGRVRSAVNQASAQAQVSAADLENERLIEQADLAIDYYELRGQDALTEVLKATVAAERNTLSLTESLYGTGIDTEAAVAQAAAQLQTTEAQLTDTGILRAEYEHAIAVLLGQPPAGFSIPAEEWKSAPPAIPFGIPSQLLERRPDIAAAERAVAAANAQIGVGIAAFYPTITLTGSGGLASTSITTLFSIPALVWSVGASLAQFIIDGGLRQATVDQYWANYDQNVATYRQTVLVAFQQVEDGLSTLRILSTELEQQALAVQSSQKALTLETERYKLGIDPFLNVLTAQTNLLAVQQTAVTLRTQQMVASVQLIEALGGGWDDSQLPSQREVNACPDKSTEAAHRQ
jgi:NodT family efflux transporter outer membrane factor (OMF) lipoprotein